jgi:hypothetical protein
MCVCVCERERERGRESLVNGLESAAESMRCGPALGSCHIESLRDDFLAEAVSGRYSQIGTSIRSHG